MGLEVVAKDQMCPESTRYYWKVQEAEHLKTARQSPAGDPQQGTRT